MEKVKKFKIWKNRKIFFQKFWWWKNFPLNRKCFHFPTFSKILKLCLWGPVSLPIFRPNGASGNFSNKIRWIGTFAKSGNSSKSWSIGIFEVEEDFPTNRKIFHFPTFSKIIFRPNGEGGNFSNKIMIEHLQVKIFR